MGESDKAAIYARKSTGKETDNRSIDEQLKACRQYAEEQGWKVEERHVFTEIHSGKSVFDRPKMKTLLTAMTNGEVNRIICYHRDRRARNMKESGWLDTEAMRHDATWHFVNSGMVPEGIEDEDDRDHMAGMEEYFSAKERKRIKERMDAGQIARVNAGGMKPGPKPPYGWERKSLGVDASGKKRPNWTLKQKKKPDEALVVAKIFRLLVEDRASIAEVTRWLRASGYPTPTRKPSAHWSEKSLKTIVRNPCHMGVAATNRTQSVPGTSSSRRRNEDEWIVLENAPKLEPIVNEATWRAANNALVENSQRSGGVKSANNQGLLSYGHIFGVCPEGHRHTLGWQAGRYKSGSKQRGARKCPIITISSGYVDEKVWNDVTKLLNEPYVLLKRLKNQMSGDGMAEDLAEAEATVARLKTSMKNVMWAVESAENDEARREASARLNELAPALKAAEMQCRSVAARAQAFKHQQDVSERFIEHLTADKKRLASLDLEGRREIIRRLDVQVPIKPDEGKGIAARLKDYTIGVMPPMIAPDETLIEGLEEDTSYYGDIEYDDRWDDIEWEYDPLDDARVDAHTRLDDTAVIGEEPAPRCNSRTRRKSGSTPRQALKR